MKKTPAFRYAMGTLGGSLPYNMFTTFMAFYYVDLLGLDIRIYSIALLFYSIFDAIDSPIYGFLSDRTRTRFGRRKPWLMVASVVFGLSFIAFFSPPPFLENNGFIAYFFIMMILVETSMSAIQVNYNSLLPDLFRSKKERANANSMRMGWMLIATIIGVALAPVITDAIGYPNTALVFGCISICVWMFVTLGVHENKDYLETENPKLIRSIKEIIANKKFWLISGVTCFYNAAQALMLAGIPFFVKYTLDLDSGSTTIMLGIVLVAAILSLIGWAAAIKRFSLVIVWRVALIILTIAFIPLFFAETMTLSIIGGFFIGIGTGGVMSTNDIVIAGLLDEDKAKYGQRREGIYQSIVGLAARLNGLFRSGAFFLVFILFGFESGDSPGPDPGSASRFLLVLVPVALMILGIAASMFLSVAKREDSEATSI